MMRVVSGRGPGSVVATLALTACAHAPAPPEPAPPLPLSYQAACALQSRAPGAPLLDTWWRGFGDDLMTRTVERALLESPSLAQAGARINRAQAAARAAGAQLLPSADLVAVGTRVHESLLDPVSRLANGQPGFDRNFTQKQLGMSATWDLDFSGGSKAQRDAALAEVGVSGGEALAVRVGLAAEVSEAYLRLRTAQARLAVAGRQEAVARRLVDLVKQRSAEGLVARREIYSAEAALAGVHAAIPPLRGAIEAERVRLEVLMGAAPGTHRTEFESESALPEAPGISGAQGPAALLRRRPDLMAAEQRLTASHARSAAALSEYYPKVSISALLGWNSAVGGQFIGSDGFTWQAGPALRWRLFDFGRVDAEVAAAREREAELLAAYRAAVLGAAAEVETAFASLLQQEARGVALDRQIDRLQSARALAVTAFDQGAISLLEVLDLDRQILTSSDQRTLARSAAALSAVASFRALGGGWQAPPPDAGGAGETPPCAAER